MFPADRADELISIEILKFLRRVSHKTPEDAVPFSTEFCAQRVEQETGFKVSPAAVEKILKKSLSIGAIGDDTDPYLIRLHHGKRVDWWERDLWWVSQVKHIKEADHESKTEDGRTPAPPCGQDVREQEG